MISLFALVLFQKFQAVEICLESEIPYEAIDLPVAVLRMAVLDPFRIFYQVHFEMTCITKKT